MHENGTGRAYLPSVVGVSAMHAFGRWLGLALVILAAACAGPAVDGAIEDDGRGSPRDDQSGEWPEGDPDDDTSPWLPGDGGVQPDDAGQAAPDASSPPTPAPTPTPTPTPTPEPEPVPGGPQHQNANLYAFWTMSAGGAYAQNVDQKITIEKKAVATFFAMLWNWEGQSFGGYIGLQTNGIRFNGTKGDTAIFSLWNAVTARGLGCGTFGGEGSGYSCRLAYPFVVGRTYRLRVWKLESDPWGQWWGAWILDESTGVEQHIGDIMGPWGSGAIMPPSNFSEYFGGDVGCNNVPVSTVLWHPPRGDQQGAGVYRSTGTYSGGNRGACVGGSTSGVTVKEGLWGSRIVQGGPR